MTTAADLLPELREWNDGRGIPPDAWLFSFARSDHAVAWAGFFWPEFTIVDGHVLRAPVPVKAFKRWRKEAASLAPERHRREAVYNTVYINEDLFGHEEWTGLVEARAAHIGRVLAQIHELKLARDFPDRRFVVELWDGSKPEHGGEVSLSFWQQP